jgi:hypothetical protein
MASWPRSDPKICRVRTTASRARRKRHRSGPPGERDLLCATPGLTPPPVGAPELRGNRAPEAGSISSSSCALIGPASRTSSEAGRLSIKAATRPDLTAPGPRASLGPRIFRAPADCHSPQRPAARSPAATGPTPSCAAPQRLGLSVRSAHDHPLRRDLDRVRAVLHQRAGPHRPTPRRTGPGSRA